MSLESGLQRIWYGPAWLGLPLWPLAWVYRAVVALRRASYSTGLLQRQRAPVPVVVVGNLTVGGTGKTPIAAWLARQIAARGHRVAVVGGSEGLRRPPHGFASRGVGDGRPGSRR